MIKLDAVRKEYPGVVALDGISLEIPDGEIHGIVGQSGAGKSTLIRCLTALEQPTDGHIWVDNKDLSALSPGELRSARRSIGMVFQGGNLLDARTAGQNIAYPLKVAGMDRGHRRERVQELLDLVGLGDRGSSYPSQLSGGQRQRIAIARALAARPSVLLCDEPTSALDTETTGQILDLIKDVRDQTGVTVVIITHEMSVVRETCDAVTLLQKGKIVQSGRVEDIVSDTSSSLSRALIPAPKVDTIQPGKIILDISFTSQPGEPASSRVLALVAELGADVTAGTFETVGSAQIARLALAVDYSERVRTIAALEAEGITVVERAS
ncbi:MAG: ATP-binding cassette domain-containing protein [Flaviflexus sp.]|uniref:methionine ABC transporter ATP-binding protein n=1 Tax=Flaviflexus sp. TaxID=1969482 RepID=UPI00352F0E00